MNPVRRMLLGVTSVGAAAAVLMSAAIQPASAAPTRAADRVPDSCAVISRAAVQRIFGLTGRQTRYDERSAHYCPWTLSNGVAMSVQVEVPDGSSIVAGPRQPGERVIREPQFSRRAFMIVEPGQTAFAYERRDTGWVYIAFSTENSRAMLQIARIIHRAAP